MATISDQKPFSPIQIGPLALKYRVVMAPPTRSRSERPGDIPGDPTLEHFTRRASGGGFIIKAAVKRERRG
jgi:N-ethylmaleimide reductase